MQLAILLGAVVIGSAVHLAMLATLWRARSKGAGEVAWAIVPWFITVLSAAPAVHHMLATGERVSAPAGAAIVAPAQIFGADRPGPRLGAVLFEEWNGE